MPKSELLDTANQIQELYRLCQTGENRNENKLSDGLSELHRTLLAPLLPRLAGVKHLIVVASGPALSVPVEIWKQPDGSYVIDDYVVSYVPSATILAWLSKDKKQEKTRSLFAAGASKFETLPRIDGAATEIRHVATQFESSEVRFPIQGAELQALGAEGKLAKYSDILIATHAVQHPFSPMENALVLPQENQEGDYRLTANAIATTWKLNQNRVTFSACSTFAGKRSQSEGFLGFSQALFIAGARNVNLSLWDVDDLPTALLMDRYKKNVREHPDWTDAKSLQQAKLWLRESSVPDLRVASAPLLQRGIGKRRSSSELLPSRYSHPRFWAPFILIGAP